MQDDFVQKNWLALVAALVIVGSGAGIGLVLSDINSPYGVRYLLGSAVLVLAWSSGYAVIDYRTQMASAASDAHEEAREAHRTCIRVHAGMKALAVSAAFIAALFTARQQWVATTSDSTLQDARRHAPVDHVLRPIGQARAGDLVESLAWYQQRLGNPKSRKSLAESLNEVKDRKFAPAEALDYQYYWIVAPEIVIAIREYRLKSYPSNTEFVPHVGDTYGGEPRVTLGFISTAPAKFRYLGANEPIQNSSPHVILITVWKERVFDGNFDLMDVDKFGKPRAFAFTVSVTCEDLAYPGPMLHASVRGNTNNHSPGNDKGVSLKAIPLQYAFSLGSDADTLLRRTVTAMEDNQSDVRTALRALSHVPAETAAIREFFLRPRKMLAELKKNDETNPTYVHFKAQADDLTKYNELLFLYYLKGDIDFTRP